MSGNNSTISQLDPAGWVSDGRPVPDIRDGRRYLIGGKILEWQGEVSEVKSCLFFNKGGVYTRPALGELPQLDEAEAMKAVDAAEAAWNDGNGEWPTMTVSKRIDAMEAFAERMGAVREQVVERMMWEIGKSQKDSYAEFDRTVRYIGDTIVALKNMDREAARFSVESPNIAQIRRSPMGVTLCMGPYNYPLNETFATLIPAVLMGNPVISKLPRYGALLNVPLLEAFRDCFPPGVVNIISGKGQTIITPIVKSGRVSLLAFIGNSKTADLLKSQHPHPHRLKSVLSLDAKNPAVVLPDADMSVTVPQLIAGSLNFNGQRCTALKIVFVHESRLDEVLAGMAAAIDGMKAGFPWTPDVKLTPVADLGAVAFLEGLLEEARAGGSKVHNKGGGEAIENYVHPALVSPVPASSQLYQVEQFGPLIPVVPFKDVCEVQRYAVNSPFGQQVSLFGYEPKALGRLIDVWVNQVSRVNLNVQCQRGPDNSERNRELLNEILAARSSNFLTTDFIF
jgi:glyceraldehyde-3-phosphate dehydrogenase (NADP+)